MSTLSPKVAETTRKEWRELGFFYVTDDDAKEWQLTGSREGLLKFADLLDAYSLDTTFAEISEHEHYGPHMYLKIMTWPQAEIDGRSIRGPQGEIARLAAIVRGRLSGARPGDSILISEEYAAAAEYSVVLHVREDEFDPATEDPQLVSPLDECEHQS